MKEINGSALDSLIFSATPPGWSWATAREIASDDENSLAIGPFGSNLKVCDYTDSGVPLVFVRNIRSGEFGGKTHSISQTKAFELKAHWVEPGDILITKMGDPPGDVCLYPQGQPFGVITADCIKFRVASLAGEPKFFVFAIRSQFVQRQIISLTKGVAQQKVSLGRFSQIWLPIPPVREQCRIVAKIEELFSDLDAGVAALERAKVNLKRYRVAVLKAAVEGKLTEQWRAEHPATEPASKLLDRILAERRKKWKADQLAKFAAAGKEPPKNWQSKYVEPAPADADALPELPSGWCWVRTDQLIAFLKNGYFQSPSPATEGHRILRINAVRPMQVNLSESRFLPSVEEGASEYLIENGDLLFTRYNGSLDLLGVAGMVRHCTTPTLHPDKLIRVKVVFHEPLAAYLEIACNVGEARRHMTRRARTTAGQTGISGADIRDMPVPLPPRAEQEQVVAEVEQRLSVIAAAEAQITAGLRRAGRLRQSILKQAFEGRLVPQDPRDEPADLLLQKIRQTRPGGNGRAARTRKARRSIG